MTIKLNSYYVKITKPNPSWMATMLGFKTEVTNVGVITAEGSVDKLKAKLLEHYDAISVEMTLHKECVDASTGFILVEYQ